MPKEKVEVDCDEAAASGSSEKYANPGRCLTNHPNCNVTPRIASLVGRGLHLKSDHPIGIVRSRIEDYFLSLNGLKKFEIFDAEDPIVTSTQNFDDLLIPKDHPSRSKSDTYWLSDTTLLRTHTSAHPSHHLRQGHEAFLCTGDLYRRDEVDKSHYPAFHQLEGVRRVPPTTAPGASPSHEEWVQSRQYQEVASDLKKVLGGLIYHLFGLEVERRWNDDSFPFTEPSYEMKILRNGEWMEVLGCSMIHSNVLRNVGFSHRRGWAFGLGLERLAMILF